MKVIIDTNVIVSAALRDRNPETVLLFVIEQPEFEWIGSIEIVEEYWGVLQRPKFRLPEDILQRWKTAFDQFVRIVDVSDKISFPRDQKDAKFLECAVSANAEYFITGDRDFEEARKISKTTILSVSKFKSLICDKWEQ